jgi:XTP/dITP diphosphohydrolase
MFPLLLATGNPGKRRELEALLAPLGFDLLDPADLHLTLQVEEVGGDYAANARLKARAFAQASRLWTLADDTGLEVEALGGAPGLRSARLLEDHPQRPSGTGSSDAARRSLLLALLQDHPRPWTAHFCCSVALAHPDGSLDMAHGMCPGEIIPGARGSEGFGYDPIFLVAGTGRTMAELSLPVKNQISHRARAIHALLPTLRQRLAGHLPPLETPPSDP